MNYLLWHAAVERAARSPADLAVSDAHGELTYGELAHESARLAGVLASWGVGRGTRVAMWMPKSRRSVVVMLGTGRAGAAYVPVDPAAPARRAATIIANSAATVLFTTSRLMASLGPEISQLTALTAIVLVDAEAAPASPSGAVSLHSWATVQDAAAAAPTCTAVESDPAYILYTSGSTGTPKGVVISHRNALTFVDWAADSAGLTAADRLSNHAPLHFDLSVFDIYGALSVGASVHLVPDRVAPFPVELAKWIAEQRISVWYSVPSALIRLKNQGQLERFGYQSLRLVIFAGEVFPVKHLRGVMDLFAHARFSNWYGPTETNVCTYFDVPRPLPANIADLPIGRPCANYDAFAFADGRRCIAGVEGELLVRGPGVMLGYWGLPQRTAESLVQNPLHSDFVDLVYRTGDFVRPKEDGSFEFIGRRDHMVKTRGYRVELGEIEHALHQHAAIGSAAVVAVPDPDIGARLWAAVVAEPGVEVSERSLASHCLSRIPHYAVPEVFAFLPELPTTSTGKVDRGALLESLKLVYGKEGIHAAP